MKEPGTEAIVEIKSVPVNFTCVVSLPNGRQVQATTSYFPTSDAEGPNRVLDTMMAALERQRAKAEILEFDEEIEKHEEAIAKADSQILDLHQKTESQIAVLREEFKQQGESYDSAREDLRADVEKDGRRVFNPDLPGNKSKLQPFMARQAQIEQEVKKLEEERAIGTKNFEANMAHFHEAIAKLKAKREARVKLVG